MFSCSSPVGKKEENTPDAKGAFYSDSGYSSIVVTKDTANGQAIYTQVKKTRSYNLVRLLWGTDYTDMLITETSSQKMSMDADGQEGNISLVGKISEKGNFNKEIWKKDLAANQVNYDWDYFDVMYFGCCGALDGKKVCRYSDGEELMNLTGDIYEVEIPNTRISRYIGYWDFNSVLERPGAMKDTLALGLLTVVDPFSRAAQHIMIKAKSDSIYENMAMSFSGLNFTVMDEKDRYNDGSRLLQLWSADKISDPNELDGFSIVLEFEWDKISKIIIPVKNGKLDISGFHSDLFELNVVL